MDIVGTFLPVAEELINQVFPTPITYIRVNGGSYNPSTGDLTVDQMQYTISAGVLGTGRTEQGGVGEDHELRLWVHHGTNGLPHLPTTSDQIEYGGLVWKVTTVDPSYSSGALIASKITARHS